MINIKILARSSPAILITFGGLELLFIREGFGWILIGLGVLLSLVWAGFFKRF